MDVPVLVDDFVLMTVPAHPYNLVWILTAISIFVYPAGLSLRCMGGFNFWRPGRLFQSMPS
jgi:hypothetical protein